MSLFILPYLHSKYIFLNRQKPNTDYFYTSIEHKIHEHQPDDSCSSSMESDYSSNNKEDDEEFFDDGEKPKDNSKMKTRTITNIICVNMTLYKQYVYSQNGTLINRFNFKDLTTKFGIPISNSANGQNFIFKQSI